MAKEFEGITKPRGVCRLTFKQKNAPRMHFFKASHLDWLA
jgi:hypothetical protein